MGAGAGGSEHCERIRERERKEVMCNTMCPGPLIPLKFAGRHDSPDDWTGEVSVSSDSQTGTPRDLL